MRQYKRRSVASRMWSRVEFGPGCWIWQGALDHHGYGVIGVDYKTPKAHRISYELAVGPIPDGLDVLHSCDNPPCVRPDHLRPGTAADNIRDCIERGRHFTPFRDAAVRARRWSKKSA